MSAIVPPLAIQVSKRRRRPAGTSDKPCSVCGYPISDRHHLLPFAKFGEGIVDGDSAFAFLCPNCHRLTHTVDGFASSKIKLEAINRLIDAAQRGTLPRYLLPEIIELVAKSRRIQLDVSLRVIEIIRSGNGDRTLAPYYNDIGYDSREAIAACEFLKEKCEDAGLYRRSALQLLMKGGPQ